MKKSTGRPIHEDPRPSARILAGDVVAALGPGAADELRRIQQPKMFAPGAHLFDQQTDAEDIFIIVSGRVRLTAHANGRRIELRVAGPGEIIGLSAAFSGSAHQYGALATEVVHAQVISRKRLLKMLESNPTLWPIFLQHLSRDVSFALSSLISIGTEAVRHHHSRV